MKYFYDYIVITYKNIDYICGVNYSVKIIQV